MGEQVKIRMLRDSDGSEDGYNIKSFACDAELVVGVDIGKELAQSFLGSGRAKLLVSVRSPTVREKKPKAVSEKKSVSKAKGKPKAVKKSAPVKKAKKTKKYAKR